MAPTRPIKTSHRPSAIQIDSSDDHDYPAQAISSGTQDEDAEGLQGNSMETLVSKMVNSQRKRHAANKQNILASYETTAKALRDDIENTFKEHEMKASAAHEAQLKTLRDLLSHKAHLEAQMATKLQELKASYDAHSQDVENVIRARVKELK